MADFTMKQNDTDPDLDVTLQSGGSPWSIPGTATVQFHMKATGGGALKVDAAAVADPDQGANPGKVVYSWAGADTDTIGTFDGEFEVTDSGEIMTFPNDVAGFSIEIVQELN